MLDLALVVAIRHARVFAKCVDRVALDVQQVEVDQRRIL